MNVLDMLHDEMQRQGRRPCIDHELELVLADCVWCDGHLRDELGIWRPMKLIPRGSLLMVQCSACGRRENRRIDAVPLRAVS